MNKTAHPIFNNKDPWLKRILSTNSVPKKIQVNLAKVRRTTLLSFASLTIIDDFLNYVPLTKDKMPLVDKSQFLQIVNLIKSSVTLTQFKTMNGPWFIKLLSDDGIHEDDLTTEAKQIVYECLSHGYMMMLLEHEYKSNNVGKAHYSVRYYVYRCGYYCWCGYYSSYTVYYYSNTMLKLKGTFTQVKSRKVAHTELGQYYTYLFGFHTKLFIQTAKAVNEFVFGELPQLDKQAVIDAAQVMDEVVKSLTKDLTITRTNIAKIETLIGSTTFALTDIDNALDSLESAVKKDLAQSKQQIATKIATHAASFDGKTGSVSDMLIAQAKNQTKSFETIGFWLYDAFKDARNKDSKINGMDQCSACMPVNPDKMGAMAGGTFGFGLALGYLAKKAAQIINKKRSAKELALIETRRREYDLEENADEKAVFTDI